MKEYICQRKKRNSYRCSTILTTPNTIDWKRRRGETESRNSYDICEIFIFSITMTSKWPRWRLKSPASPLFAQMMVQAQIKNQSSVSLAFVRGIHRWPVDSPHERPVTRKLFPFHDVIMLPERPIVGLDGAHRRKLKAYVEYNYTSIPWLRRHFS